MYKIGPFRVQLLDYLSKILRPFTTPRYNASVEIVFQSTALLQRDSNPMHLHGYDFFVLAQGLGNFNPKRDVKKFNYHNPQLRNTVQVPRTGWAAVRFVTDNPGTICL